MKQDINRIENDMDLHKIDNLLSSSIKSTRTLSQIQGVFFIVSGLWPIQSMRTFENVTGPKQDDWLVKTVGLLIASSGFGLFKAGLRSAVTKEMTIIGAGQALSLGSISLIYSLKGRISKVYLLDAAIEFILVGLWYFASQTKQSRSSKHIGGIPSFDHAA